MQYGWRRRRRREERIRITCVSTDFEVARVSRTEMFVEPKSGLLGIKEKLKLREFCVTYKKMAGNMWRTRTCQLK